MKPRESRSWSPMWLEHSGLPEFLTDKVRGGFGWLVFKKIIELDCEKNSAPGTVEISLDDLKMRCGVPPDKLRRTIEALRKQKLIACFLPDNDEEAALFRVVTPLQTPIPVEQIRRNNLKLFEHQYFRYHDDCVELSEDDLPASDPGLQEVVDLYFDVVGLKMNVFILDELRMLPQRFKLSEIRSVFNMARKNEIRSLHWVIQELVRRRKKSGEQPEPVAPPQFADHENDDMKF